MGDKKYCRPRMTVEARDAINNACDKLAEVCKEEKERSDLIVSVLKQVDSFEALWKLEKQTCKWWADGFRGECKSHLKTKKVLLMSVMLNVGLIAYMVFS